MNIVKYNAVQDKIISVRDQNVILDSDVAALYGVETRRINEAVSNNPDKFPTGYIIELYSEEWKILKSKFSTSSWGGKNKLPKAFTRKGLYMLATILKGDRATETTIAIIEAFDKIMELQATVAELSECQDKIQQKSLMQKGGEIFSAILGDDLKVSDSETTVELDFAMLKFKHTIKI